MGIISTAFTIIVSLHSVVNWLRIKQEPISKRFLIVISCYLFNIHFFLPSLRVCVKWTSHPFVVCIIV